MKFGKLLSREAVRSTGYANYYLSYKDLKKFLSEEYEATKNNSSNKSFDNTNGTTILDFLNQISNIFTREIENQIEKINGFVIAQERNLLIFLKEVERNKDSINVESLEGELEKISEGICLLKRFVQFNYIGFKKILKKYDKKVNGLLSGENQAGGVYSSGTTIMSNNNTTTKKTNILPKEGKMLSPEVQKPKLDTFVDPRWMLQITWIKKVEASVFMRVDYDLLLQKLGSLWEVYRQRSRKELRKEKARNRAGSRDTNSPSSTKKGFGRRTLSRENVIDDGLDEESIGGIGGATSPVIARRDTLSPNIPDGPLSDRRVLAILSHYNVNLQQDPLALQMIDTNGFGLANLAPFYFGAPNIAYSEDEKRHFSFGKHHDIRLMTVLLKRMRIAPINLGNIIPTTSTSSAQWTPRDVESERLLSISFNEVVLDTKNLDICRNQMVLFPGGSNRFNTATAKTRNNSRIVTPSPALGSMMVESRNRVSLKWIGDLSPLEKKDTIQLLVGGVVIGSLNPSDCAKLLKGKLDLDLWLQQSLLILNYTGSDYSRKKAKREEAGRIMEFQRFCNSYDLRPVCRLVYQKSSFNIEQEELNFLGEMQSREDPIATVAEIYHDLSYHDLSHFRDGLSDESSTKNSLKNTKNLSFDDLVSNNITNSLFEQKSVLLAVDAIPSWLMEVMIPIREEGLQGQQGGIYEANNIPDKKNSIPVKEIFGFRLQNHVIATVLDERIEHLYEMQISNADTVNLVPVPGSNIEKYLFDYMWGRRGGSTDNIIGSPNLGAENQSNSLLIKEKSNHQGGPSKLNAVLGTVNQILTSIQSTIKQNTLVPVQRGLSTLMFGQSDLFHTLEQPSNIIGNQGLLNQNSSLIKSDLTKRSGIFREQSKDLKDSMEESNIAANSSFIKENNVDGMGNSSKDKDEKDGHGKKDAMNGRDGKKGGKKFKPVGILARKAPVDNVIGCDPKTYFSNERTFMRYLHVAALLVALSITLNRSPHFSSTKMKQITVLFLYTVGAFTILWSWGLFYARLELLAKTGRVGIHLSHRFYGSTVAAPELVGAALFIAFGVCLIMSFMDLGVAI